MTRQEHFRRPSRAVAGRIEELRRLEACERGLIEAYAAYGRQARGDTRWVSLRERNLGHAALLARRIRELGGALREDSDDEWIVGSPRALATLVEAEHKARRTYHDHLTDLDPETMALVRERILPAHEQTLAQLLGERDLAMEPYVK
jgi:hypothetical protein